MEPNEAHAEALRLIEESTRYNKTVHAPYDEELWMALLTEGHEDDADVDGDLDMWGTTDSGSEWRVCLEGGAGK